MNLMSRLPLMLLALLVLGLAQRTSAQWNPPADGLLTEKQVQAFLNINRDVFATFRQQGQRIDNAQTGAARVAAALALGGQYEAIITRHGLTLDEFGWVNATVTEAWLVGFQQQVMVEALQGPMTEAIRENEQRTEKVRAQIAADEKALAAGTRVLTDAQRKQIIAQAREERQAALEEAAGHAAGAKEADEEAREHDAQAAEQARLAANPPADVEPGDRADFIRERQAEAAEARQAAAEARARAADERKAEQTSRAAAEAAGRRIAQPDVPQTDAEKQEFRAEIEQRLAAARQELALLQAMQAQLSQTVAEMGRGNQEAVAGIKPRNLELVTKYAAEIRKMYEDAGQP